MVLEYQLYAVTIPTFQFINQVNGYILKQNHNLIYKFKGGVIADENGDDEITKGNVINEFGLCSLG